MSKALAPIAVASPGLSVFLIEPVSHLTGRRWPLGPIFDFLIGLASAGSDQASNCR
jgi:hypothetical protein